MPWSADACVTTSTRKSDDSSTGARTRALSSAPVTRVLALDVGSSSVRAAVFEEDGSPLEGAAEQVPYAAPSERDAQTELDTERVVEACRYAAERALEHGGRVDAVGVSCFWHSLLPLDERGRPLSALMTWRD